MATKHVRIFVASPGDVIAERDLLNTVVNELARTCAALLPSRDIVIELLRWETHAYPSMGRPQGVINAQIADYDIFIGILWKRFGSPTGRAESGTEEEFQRAFERWQKTNRPHILFYFNTAPIAPPKNPDEIRQLALLADFRCKVEKEGLVWEYSGSNRFGDTVRPHLTEVIGALINEKIISDEERVPGQDAPQPSETALPEPSGEELAKEPAIVAGEMIRIVDIGKLDAWYNSRDELIGHTARMIEASTAGNGWYQGSVTLDPVPTSVTLPKRVFAQFKFANVTA